MNKNLMKMSANDMVGAATKQVGMMQTQQVGAAAAETANAIAMHQRAMLQGRDETVTEERLVKDFQNQELAKEGIYELTWAKPAIRGLSVRAAEQIMYRWGHTCITSSVQRVSDTESVIQVRGLDLVNNNMIELQGMISHTVERNRQDTSRVLVNQRTNTRDETVYIYEATEQEMLQKANSLQSKLRRNVVLQMLPPNIKNAIFDTAMAAKQGEFKNDPRTALKNLLEAFRSIKVSATDLTKYLGHGVSEVNSEEWADLQNLYAAIKNKDVKMSEAIRDKQAERKETEDPEETKDD